MRRKLKCVLVILLLTALLLALVSCGGSKTYYILNVKSKKIHHSDCGTAARISQENRQIYKGDIEELFEIRYTKCGNCFS